jgi:hypothetical protein
LGLAQCKPLADRWRIRVTTEARLAELKQQHRAIEENIVEILKYSYAEDLKIVELKRQKLKIKDEIERLRQGQTP